MPYLPVITPFLLRVWPLTSSVLLLRENFLDFVLRVDITDYRLRLAVIRRY